MIIKISDKNRREMSPERDYPEAFPVRRRYCILSSPRSGSTLLGRMLSATRIAGDPQEYFNPPLLACERETTGNEKLGWDEFMRRMEARRTSPNGVFGMKMHYSQMLGAFGVKTPNQRMVAFLERFDHLLWIRRRDKLGQAISHAIAQQTQVWSSEDENFGKNLKVNVHPFQCIQALTLVAGNDFGWERLLPATSLSVHQIWYEDLVADYDKQSRTVLEYLGLDDQVIEVPPPPIERQATELNKRLRESVLTYLGLNGDRW